MNGRFAGVIAFIGLCVALAAFVLGALLDARVRAVERREAGHRRASEALIEVFKEQNPSLVIPDRGPFEEAAGR